MADTMVRLSPGAQRESYVMSTGRLNIWEGAVRAGKTIGSIMRWVQFIKDAPPGPLMMIGKTERTLQRNILDPMVEWLGHDRCKVIAGAGVVEVCGRKVYMVGANDERAQEKIRGMTLIGFYADEVSTLPESFFQMLMSRMSLEGAKGFGTTNPDAPNHWLKKRYLDRAEIWRHRDGNWVRKAGAGVIDCRRFSFTIDDNPHLPDSYRAAIKLEYTGLWYRRFILGEWVMAEGAIYEAFDHEKHVLDELPPITKMVSVGVDYGTRNPFSAVEIGLGVYENRPVLVATREYRWDPSVKRKQKTDAEFSRDLRAWMLRNPQATDPKYVAVDPSAASFRVQLHQDKVRGLAPAHNEVLDGIRLVGSLFARNQLYVHKSCTGLIDELPAYSWDDKKAEKGEDAPVKVDDHSVDALRYGIVTPRVVWEPILRGRRTA